MKASLEHRGRPIDILITGEVHRQLWTFQESCIDFFVVRGTPLGVSSTSLGVFGPAMGSSAYRRNT